MRHIHFFIRVVYINFKMYLKVQDNTFIRRITMSKTEQVEKLTNYMANFVSYIGKVLPDDIIAKLDELAEKDNLPDNETESEARERFESSKLPGHRSITVLGKMWNKVPTDR